MRITDLRIDGFGVWRDLSINDLTDRVTVVYGENEAGKTTLMQFVRTVLYGFSPDRCQRYLPPIHGGQPGGRLSIELPHGQYQIRRHMSGARSGVGDVEVTSADGAFQSCHQLPTLLGGIDEPIFNNVFALGLREIQELATLNDTQAAQHFYDLTTGMDRVSLFEVMRELAASRARILADEDRPAQLAQLVSRRQQLEEEIRRLRGRTGEWIQLAGQIRSAHDEIAQLEQRAASLERETRLVEIGCNARGSWQQRTEVEAQLAGLGAVAEVPADELETLQQLSTQVAEHRARLHEIKQRRKSLRQQAAAVDVNDKLWRHAARVEALAEQRPWIASLGDQVSRLEQEILELDDQLSAEQRQFGFDKGRALGASLPQLSESNLAALREPALDARDQKQRLDSARRDAESAQEESRRIQEMIEGELATRGERDLGEAMERYGQRVSQLRRHTQADDRLERLKRHGNELQQQAQSLMGRQVLPLRILTALGVLFIAGMVLLLTALFSPVFALASSTAWGLAILGLVALMASAALKYGLQWAAARQLDECYRQEELIQMQIDKATAELGQTDNHQQRGGGPLTSRLQTAEQEMAALEELLPLESQREVALQDAEAAQRRVAQANEAYQTARGRWRSTLRSLGLPQTLSPKQVKGFANGCRSLSEKHERINARREELEQRQRELAGVASRAAQLLVESGITPHSLQLTERVEQLAHELHAQEQLVEQRNEILKESRELRREYLRHSRAGRKVMRQQREILRRIGVDIHEELGDLVEKLRQVSELRVTRDELSAKIAASMGVVCEEDELAPHVEAASQEQLESRLESLLAQFDSTSDQLKSLYERRGRLTEQLDTLAQDRRLAEVQLDLACVEKKIEDAAEQWQVLGVISLVLEEIRTLYESDRQPETLRQASEYLTQLTRGRYTRVWTPLGDNVLKVDDGSGRSFPVEFLSRGTREQVYLSLRLALAAAYARRGIILPLVLDDVLVNFDTARADAAAKVLRDFAKAGHQILVFTCHEHIMKIFRKLKIEVRELPPHGQRASVGQIQAPPPEAQIAPPIMVEPQPIVVDQEEIEEELVDEPEEEIVAEEEVEEEVAEEEEEELELADVEEEEEEEFEFSTEEVELTDDEEEEEYEEEEFEDEEALEEDDEPEEEVDKAEAEYSDGETEWEEDEAYEQMDDDEAAGRLEWQNEWEDEDGAEEENRDDSAEAA